MALGARGLREAAEVSMINSQYLVDKVKKIRGISLTYPGRRVDQGRWSLEQMKKDTGCGISEVNRRVIDYGIQSFFTSHHPWLIPEPFTPEPCETYSKADIDYWWRSWRRYQRRHTAILSYSRLLHITAVTTGLSSMGSMTRRDGR